MEDDDDRIEVVFGFVKETVRMLEDTVRELAALEICVTKLESSDPPAEPDP